MAVNIYMDAKLDALSGKLQKDPLLGLFPVLPSGVSAAQRFGQAVNLLDAVDSDLLSSLGWGNAPTDELGARMTANAYIAARTGAGRMWIPPGTHEISSTIYIENTSTARTVVLDAAGATLKAVKPMDACVRLRGFGTLSPFARMSGLGIDANGLACMGFDIQRANQHTTLLEGLRVWRARGTGFLIRASQGLSMHNCVASECGGDGMFIAGLSAGRMEACMSRGNGGSGFVMTTLGIDPYTGAKAAGSWGESCLVNCIAESNGADGFRLARPGLELGRGKAFFRYLLRDVNAVNNGGDGIVIGDPSFGGVVIDGATLRPSVNTSPSSMALRIETTSCAGPKYRRVVAKNLTVATPVGSSTTWTSRPWSVAAGGCYDVAEYNLVGNAASGPS